MNVSASVSVCQFFLRRRVMSPVHQRVAPVRFADIARWPLRQMPVDIAHHLARIVLSPVLKAKGKGCMGQVSRLMSCCCCRLSHLSRLMQVCNRSIDRLRLKAGRVLARQGLTGCQHMAYAFGVCAGCCLGPTKTLATGQPLFLALNWPVAQ